MLVNLATYYSFRNIDKSNNCISYLTGANALWVDIFIPEGCFDVEDINEFVQQEMRKMVTKQVIRIALKYQPIQTHSSLKLLSRITIRLTSGLINRLKVCLDSKN